MNLLIFKDLAEMMAIAQAEELEAKKGLLQSKEEYVKAKTIVLEESLNRESKDFFAKMQKARLLLESALQCLSEPKKSEYGQNLAQAGEMIQKMDFDAMAQAESLQTYLKLSDAVLLWIYEVGYHHFESKKYEEALPLFLFLVVLNPLVCDYWIAVGFAQRALGLPDQALDAFSVASFLNPNNPYSRYNGAEIYISQSHFQEAIIELEALSKIIEEQKLSGWTSHLDRLLQKAQNKQTT